MIDDNTMEEIQRTRAKHGFLTFFYMKDAGLKCGIVQNETAKFIMLYDFEKIIDPQAKQRFLKYADEWWWESNQSTPIDIFIGRRFDEFQPALIGYPKKAIEGDLIGPTYSVADQFLKRIKKKRIDIICGPVMA